MRYIFLIVLSFLIDAALPVQAEDVAGAVAREGVRAAFEELERQMIYKYFGEHRSYVYEDEDDDEKEYDGDKGKKHKKKGLPPGIAKKLERGGTLPPGIAKQFLPDDLERQLPPAPHGYERRIVNHDVLLVEIDTGKIADIITDAVLGD
jgi:hypothetical protein